MVLSLGPAKFYGSSLPRPRFYTDVKLSDARVDPPVSVLDPLLSWADEAHWSMGGVSFNRVRFQGKIEGNVDKLRDEKEKISTPIFKLKGKSSSVVGEDEVSKEERDGSGLTRKRRRLVRKLGDDLDMVDDKKVSDEGVLRSVALRTRRRRTMVLMEEEEESDEDGEMEEEFSKIEEEIVEFHITNC